MRRYFLALAVILAGFALPTPVSASEPGWDARIIMPQPQRSVIENTPMIYRPYRPLHFYGNTVRRLHYHGRPWPSLQEFGTGIGVILRPKR